MADSTHLADEQEEVQKMLVPGFQECEIHL
jgi:hypothetical protein